MEASIVTDVLGEDGWAPCDEALFENRVSGGGTTDPEDPDEACRALGPR